MAQGRHRRGLGEAPSDPQDISDGGWERADPERRRCDPRSTRGARRKMIEVPWPRYMVKRKLAGGEIADYWAARKKDIEAGFPIKACQSLGASYAEAVRRCDGDPSVEGDRGFNGALDDWRAGKPVPTGAPLFGSLKWLFHRY